MKQKTEKSLNEQRCIVAYLDGVHVRLPSVLRPQGGAFKGELSYGK